MNNNQNRIRIAIQKSGRLSEESFELLRGCGIYVKLRKEQLFCRSDNFEIDLLLVRDDDIPNLVLEGVCDFGIVGSNVLQEQSLQRLSDGLDTPISVICPLNFGFCRLAIAMPINFSYENPQSLESCKIATSYPYLLRDFFRKNKINTEVTLLSGSVEIAPRLGLADGICDLVSTGATLEANNLQEVQIIFQSQAVLIQSTRALSMQKQYVADILLNRIRGYQCAEGSKYIMLHAPKSALQEVVALLPGAESPTILELQGNVDKVVIHALCQERVFWETMEALKIAGASSILVLPVEKMLM